MSATNINLRNKIIRNGEEIYFRLPKNDFEWNEYMKCKKDFFYFHEKYVPIETTHDFKPEKLHDFQKKSAQYIFDYHFLISLKSRQVGFTTLVGSLILWGMLFYNEFQAGVISKNASEASKFINKKIKNPIKYISKHAPFLLKPIQTWNEKSVVFQATNSAVYSSASSGMAQRGGTLNFLFIDEAAFCQSISEFWGAAVPTLTRTIQSYLKDIKKGKKDDFPFGLVICSTPNKKKGIGRWYYEKWKEIRKDFEEGKSVKIGDVELKFPAQIVHWSEIPEFDEDWYKYQCELLKDPILQKQELDLEFIDKYTELLPQSFFDKFKVKEPISTRNNVYFYVNPVPTSQYILGADPASGMAENPEKSDFNAFTIIDVLSGETVADYKDAIDNKLTPISFAKLINEIAEYYNFAYVIIEKNKGEGVIDALINLYKYPVDKMYKKYNFVKDELISTTYGITTTGANRQLLLSDLLINVREDRDKLNSERLKDELKDLTIINGRIEAASGSHDDLVLSKTFTIQLRKEYFGIFPGQKQAGIEIKLNNRIYGGDLTGVYSAVNSNMSFDNIQKFESIKDSVNQSMDDYLRKSIPNWDNLPYNIQKELRTKLSSHFSDINNILKKVEKK